jgi:hypothetical protein
MKFRKNSLSFGEGISGILIVLILALVFFVFFNIFWGILKLIYFLFARKVYFIDCYFGKFYSIPIKNWFKIKGYKIYPVYLILILLSCFFWKFILFGIALAFILYPVLSFLGRDLFAEIEDNK